MRILSSWLWLDSS